MSVRILIGDCRERLSELPDASVHCCVTSPPYFGLRDYGTAQWDGGSADCDHMERVAAAAHKSSTLGPKRDGLKPDNAAFKAIERQFIKECGKCGATRIDRQMGLEPTPDEFVAGMVEVFREVRRVLRDDGVLFLNIGDSYHSGNGRTTGGCSPKSTLGGGGGRYRAGSKAEAMFNQSVERDPREAACDTTDKALEDCLENDCFCQSLCGACRAAYQIGKSHSGHRPVPTPSASSSVSSPGHTELPSDRLPKSDSARQPGHSLDATRDPAPIVDRECEPPPAALASTTPRSLQQPSETCSVAQIRVGECRLCARSLADCAPASEDMVECICGSASLASADHNRGMDASGLACPSFTTESLKPKDLIGIPWMLAFALRADGWYLRQDIIWSKPNPMPESVRDRCTKAHEYLFLLSKGPRYYYDAEAIADEAITAGKINLGFSPDRAAAMGRSASGNELTGGKDKARPDTRNKRSVWEVATQPFSEAHFATYPPALIEPCILAGCPKGGMVLDPFGGAGTTGLVADRLGRNATLIELNPEYAEIARNRLAGDGGMFADVKVAA